MSKFRYEFYIEIDREGKQRPFMMIGPIGKFQHLGNLVNGCMSNSNHIQEVLNEVHSVINNEKENYLFAGDDWCIVDFRRNRSLIVNGFDEFEPFEIDSKLILKLMEDWYEFLLKWEKNEIPGIMHPDKRETS